MKNNPCPKCGSNEIIPIPAEVGFSVRGGNFIFLGWTIFSAIPVTRYVCSNCGYSEEWIEQKDDIQKLKKKLGARGHNKS